jgi:predicted phage-related endonuclease
MIVTFPNKQEWLEARRHVLTASQAAILWTAHIGGKLWPGSTPHDVWAEKCDPDYVQDYGDTVHTWLGKALELPICEWVASQVGMDLEYPAPYTMHTNDVHPWMAATPDAFGEMHGGGGEMYKVLIEAKTGSWADEWGDTGSPMVPTTYLAQGTWQMAVCEIDVCYVGVYLGYAVEGYKRPKVVKDLRWYKLDRILAVESMMIKVCEDWWSKHVETGFPPPRENKIKGKK